MPWPWSRKPEEPKPKQEPEEPNVIQEKLDQMNALEAYWRPGRIDNNVIIDHKRAEIQRELLHEQGVIPIVDRKTGKWKLFSIRVK